MEKERWLAIDVFVDNKCANLFRVLTSSTHCFQEHAKSIVSRQLKK